MMNKVVVRYADGHMVKGTTTDFFPGKEVFHVNVANSPAGSKPVEIYVVSGLKAVFFVKDLAGDPQHVKSNQFDPAHPPIGRKIKVVFKDGETIIGTTTGYQPGRSGFFLVPADTEGNNERCYVITTFTKEINFL